MKWLILILLVGGTVGFSSCSSTTPPRSKWQQGYSAGQADAAKRQYFAQRNLYKYEFERSQKNPGVRRYSFVIPPNPNVSGEKLVPYTVTIPVEQ
ncbi:MAG: hypothetical protein C5B47_02515 [Verrucomicrobia bacterium]|nr:MAG: hypothetical protein C5B47_02515 [Verrucomicrobiota bacterium]